MFSVKTSLKLYSCFLFCGIGFSRTVVNAASSWLIVVKRAFKSPTKETDKREEREMVMDLLETHEPRNCITTNLVKGCFYQCRRWQWCCTSE
ncbi:hypothetical protein AAG906_015464 [Vitis piasezkii]